MKIYVFAKPETLFSLTLLSLCDYAGLFNLSEWYVRFATFHALVNRIDINGFVFFCYLFFYMLYFSLKTHLYLAVFFTRLPGTQWHLLRIYISMDIYFRTLIPYSIVELTAHKDFVGERWHTKIYINKIP